MAFPVVQHSPQPLWLDKISFNELRAGGYIDLSPRFNNDLRINSNPIHPLFHRSQWIYLSNEDFALLQPSLQLASKLLVSPRFLSFWHALLRSRHHVRTDGLRAMYGRHCDRIDLVDRELTHLEKVRLWEAFVNLTNFHRFRFVEEATLVDADATTDLVQSPGFFPLTHSSISRISDRYLRLLRQYASGGAPTRGCIPSPTDWPTDASITRTSFHLAKNLVHELCHAFNNAVSAYDERHLQDETRIKIEPFFMDQRRCELGRAWESFVFGGHIDGIGDGLNMQFGTSVTKWPHPFSQEGQERAPSRRPYMTSYAIPMAWIEALWTNDFWHQVGNSSGFDFRIPKILGLRKATKIAWTAEDEEYECFSDTDDSELAEMANDQRAEALEKRMRTQIRERLGLEEEYEDSEDSSVARKEDTRGVIRDGG